VTKKRSQKKNDSKRGNVKEICPAVGGVGLTGEGPPGRRKKRMKTSVLSSPLGGPFTLDHKKFVSKTRR